MPGFLEDAEENSVLVHTIEDNPAKLLLRQSHLHDEPQGRQDMQTLAHGVLILQVHVTVADQLVVANIFAVQSMKLKHIGKLK